MRSLLLLTVLLALIREGEGQPKVSLRPKYPQVFVGDDVTLICNREGGRKTTKWFINGTSAPPEDYVMLLTAVTPENNGKYVCEQNGIKSEPYNLTVLELEPFAQLSPSVGGAVMTKGDGRNLVLQADDNLKAWSCFVLRGVSNFALYVDVDEKMDRAVIFAEFKEAERVTFWCKKKNNTLRSNAVTLKKTELMVMLDPPAVPVLQGEPVALRCVVWGGPEMVKASFFKNSQEIQSPFKDKYEITHPTQSDNGNYSCRATYRFSHISAQAARKEGLSDAQELKVIGGPPAAVISETTDGLQCSCPKCPAGCTSYHWYHTLFDDPYARTKLSDKEYITVEKEGQYSCRKECGEGFSRFSNTYSHKVQTGSNVIPILVALILVVLGLLIVLLVALKRRRGQSAIQETKRDKDKTTGGDYEQIQLKDKDKAVYHTLGESQSKDQAEGGYEPLQKRKEEGVYHTVALGGPGEGQSEGGYEALKNVKAEVYQTLSSEGSKKPGEGQSEGQGGYEALKNVKTEVYQTLSSDDSKKPTGEAEGGYEKLPQKDKDYETVTVEENPYEEVKKQMSKEKE